MTETQHGDGDAEQGRGPLEVLIGQTKDKRRVVMAFNRPVNKVYLDRNGSLSIARELEQRGKRLLVETESNGHGQGAAEIRQAMEEGEERE